MPLRSLPAILLLLAAILSSPARADGPADNDPDHVRPVPKPGIEVPEADRKELEAGLAKLGALLEEILPGGPKASDRVERIDGIPERWDDYADVAVFHRAVRVALEDREFFDVKEIEAAKKLLEAGLDRARQASRGLRPWRSQRGLVVRGYVSNIDLTPQPFGVVIPDSYDFEDPKPHRLDVWFHGRGETLSEVNFLAQRVTNPGPITPPNTIVLHPYGRYCNANKFAGEVDAREALHWLRSRGLDVDPHRISVRGFSMGGAACWHFAVHSPGDWFAANPGAGFSETPEFLKFFQKETLTPPWWEEKLWRWYDCPGYVENLKDLPVVAYSGENDIQKQAADVMEAACEKAGMKLLHLVGPKTGHSIHPDAAKEIEARLAQWAADASLYRFDQRDRLEFVTYSLIYPGQPWLQLQKLKEHWEKAHVVAERKGEGDIRVATRNVAQMQLTLGDRWRGKGGLKRLVIDEDEFTSDAHPNLRGELSFRWDVAEGCWKFTSQQDRTHAGRAKNLLTCGPIDHAFMSSFIFVKPSGKCAHPAVQAWVDAEMNRAVTQWRRQMRGDARVKLDTEITENDFSSANLVLWGDRQANAWIAKVIDALPIQWDDSRILAGEQRFDAANHALIAIYPNPHSAGRYVVLNSGFTYREYDYLNNARQTPKLPDWAIVDLRTPPNSRWPGKIVAADFFDEEWRLKPPRAK
jgi:acetyl esterase/lipase